MSKTTKEERREQLRQGCGPSKQEVLDLLDDLEAAEARNAALERVADVEAECDRLAEENAAYAKLRAALAAPAASRSVERRLAHQKSAPAAFAPARCWTEDYEEENGKYLHRCRSCQSRFLGHKHRENLCKLCAPERGECAACASGEGRHTCGHILGDDATCVDWCPQCRVEHAARERGEGE